MECCVIYTGWTKNPDHLKKFVTLSSDDMERQGIYHNVQCFVRSKISLLLFLVKCVSEIGVPINHIKYYGIILHNIEMIVYR